MALNIKIAGLGDDATRIKTIIAGNQGAGKTLMSSTFPNPFYAACEPGLLSLRKRKVPYHEVKSQGEMDDIIRLMRQPAAVREQQLRRPVDTLVIDTVDAFQKILKRSRLQVTGKEILAQQDWGWLGETMRSYFAAWSGLDMNVVLNVHLKRVIEEETGHEYFVPRLEGSSRDDIADMFDLVGVLQATTRTVVDEETRTPKKVTERMFITAPSPQYDWLKDRSGVVPHEFPVDLETDYQRLSKYIFEDAEAMESTLDDLRKMQEELDEATADLADAVAEEAPAVEVSEPIVPDAPDVPDPKPVAAEAERISADQFGELKTLFGSIPDATERRVAKDAFIKEFGNPMTLPLAKFDEAFAYAKEMADTAGEPTVEVAPEVEAPAEPEPEATEDQGTKCADCSEVIDDIDVEELSTLQVGKPLCSPCLRKRSTGK